MLYPKREKGVALIAAVVITLIVSLVAVAIASTALANKWASSSTYDITSSFANAQTGLNLGEVILLTAAADEIDQKDKTKSLAEEVDASCSEYSEGQKALESGDACFWWIGGNINSISGNINSSAKEYNGKTVNFIGGTGDEKSKYFDYEKARTVFKLELRPEVRSKSLETGETLGRRFFRVTSIASGNYGGIAKVQGQIGMFTQIDQPISVDKSALTDD